MDDVVLKCPECGKRLGVPVESAGGTGKCSGCGATFEIPLAIASLPRTGRTPDRAQGKMPVGGLPWKLGLAVGLPLCLVLVALGVYAVRSRLPGRQAARPVESAGDPQHEGSGGTVAPPAVEDSLTPQQIAEAALPSVVMLVILEGRDRRLSVASGFFVDEGVVATNYHVMQGGRRGYVKLVGETDRHEMGPVLKRDEERDLLLLKVDARAPALPLSDRPVAVGDKVYVLGNPEGLEGTFSEGIVSAMRTLERDTFIQITAPISPGSSGGPVLNDRAEVIGIAVATVREGQNLNFAIPVSYLKALLR